MERILIFFLLFACSAGMVNTRQPNRTLFSEIIKDIINFEKCEVVKTVNETLLAPIHVQNKCMLTAFSSFVNLTLLLEPVGGQQDCMRRFLSQIKNVHHNMHHSVWDPKCSACMESLKEQSLKVFLENFKSLLQRMYRNARKLHMITCI